MSDLTDFLLERIAEDEEYARAAASASSREWLARSYRVVTADLFEVGELAVPTSAHVARHDPARVLAECEAKRRIVELHNVGDHTCQGPEHATWAPDCHTLRALALPYADHPDHPDYREEWAL